MVAHRESATLAERFIGETCARQGHRPRPADHPRRPRARDDLEARGAAAGRPRRHQDPRAPARLQRQPVLGGAVQDPEVPAGVPGALRLDPGRPGPLPRLLPLVQHRAPSQRPRPAHARTTCTHGLAEQRVAARATCSPPPMPPTRNASPRGLPQPPARPEAVWINPPKPPATEETRGLAAPQRDLRGGVLDRARPGQLLSAHRSDLLRVAAAWRLRR